MAISDQVRCRLGQDEGKFIVTINAHIGFWFGQFKTQFIVAISDMVGSR